MTKERAFEILNRFPRCAGGCDELPIKITCDECDDAFYTALKALKEPEIVRCKDCVHRGDSKVSRMPDREKVIKGVRKCLSHKPCSENGCPYENECAVEHLNDPLLRDALSLLKEQEDAYSKLSKEYLSLAHRAAHRPNIVRCKDCRYYEPTPAKDEPDRGWCNGRCSDLPAVHGDWFCGDAKRKEGR